MVLPDRPAGCEGSTLQPFPGAGRPGTSLLQVLQSKKRNCQLSSSSSSYHCFAQPPLLPRRLSVYQCFGPSRCVPQELSFSQCFPPARGFPKDSAHINVLRSRVLRSRPRPPKELSFYHCFGPPVTAPHKNSMFINVSPSAVLSHKNSSFLTVFPSRRPLTKNAAYITFSACSSFQPTSTQLFSMFCWNRDSHNVGAPTIKEGSTLLAIARPNIFRRRHFVPNLQLATCNLQSARSP